MTFSPFKIPMSRPNRSQLFVPAIKVDLFEKAIKSNADVITFDLEDSIAPQDKLTARCNIIHALQTLDFGNKIVSVRVNAADTYFCYRDIIDIVEQGGERLDYIMFPKVGTASDLYAFDMIVTQAENATKRSKKHKFEIIMESALGLVNLKEIVQASPRLVSVHFGCADYAASMGMTVTGIGGTQNDYGMLSGDVQTERRDFYLNDPWHYPIVQMVSVCRAFGILPIDGPFGDYSDAEAYKAQARRSSILGCVGKWAIHPKQVALANEIFTPSEELILRAEKILHAMEEAVKAGLGAATLDGRLIDLASVRQAEVIVNQAHLLRYSRG